MFEKTLTLADSTWLSASFFPVSCRKQVRDMLQVLHYTGIIEADSSGDDLLWRRSSVHLDFPDSEEKQKVIILPDFSAVLPQEVPPDVLYAFAQLGILSNLDRIYKGTVDRDMVNESLSRGISGDVLLAHLSGWETPVNVIETVKEWIREFSRLSVLCRETIVTFDEKTSRQIGSYPALENLIEPVSAQTVFAIKKGHEKETRDILKAMGFDPRVPEIKHVKPISAQHLVFGVSFEELTLVDNFDSAEKKVSRSVHSGKYSEKLKVLEVNELFHVIDYTILMGHLLKIEYEGSPYIRQGEYTITPLKIINDTEPFVEGKTKGSNTTKKYYIKKIKKIGVLS